MAAKWHRNVCMCVTANEVILRKLTARGVSRDISTHRRAGDGFNIVDSRWAAKDSDISREWWLQSRLPGFAFYRLYQWLQLNTTLFYNPQTRTVTLFSTYMVVHKKVSPHWLNYQQIVLIPANDDSALAKSEYQYYMLMLKILIKYSVHDVL